MKKRYHILIFIILMIPVSVYAIARFLEYKAIRIIATYVNTHQLPGISLNTETPVTRPCLFQACLRIPNITLRHPDGTSFQTGPIDATLPLLPWPTTLHVTTPDSDTPLHIQADLTRHTATIHTLSLSWNSFLLDLNGTLDYTLTTGQLSLQTVGLRSFLIPLLPPEYTQWLLFGLRDTPQKLTLSIHNGQLTPTWH